MATDVGVMGGAFNPDANYNFTGNVTVSGSLNVTGTSSGSGAAVTTTGTQTLTNKTIASSSTIPYVAGVAAGYKLARVAIALDGSNPTPWATGLTTIVACGGSLSGTAAPGVGTSVLTFDISTATVNIYAWKVTATGDCTLVASTGTETVYVWAVGT